MSVDTDVVSASGFVSMVGGGIKLESGTLDDSSLTDDAITLESGSTTHLEPFAIILESVTSDTFRGDGETSTFTLTNLNANNDTITLYVDNILTKSTNILGNTVFTLSGTTLTFTDAPANGAIIYLQGSDTDPVSYTHLTLPPTPYV